MKIKILTLMRKLTTWGIKESYKITTLEIRVTILEMQVRAILGMASMKGQEIKEIGKIKMGIGMVTMMYMYL